MDQGAKDEPWKDMIFKMTVAASGGGVPETTRRSNRHGHQQARVLRWVCDFCRRAKLRCTNAADGHTSCERCTDKGLRCAYSFPPRAQRVRRSSSFSSVSDGESSGETRLFLLDDATDESPRMPMPPPAAVSKYEGPASSGQTRALEVISEELPPAAGSSLAPPPTFHNANQHFVPNMAYMQQPPMPQLPPNAGVLPSFASLDDNNFALAPQGENNNESPFMAPTMPFGADTMPCPDDPALQALLGGLTMANNAPQQQQQQAALNAPRVPSPQLFLNNNSNNAALQFPGPWPVPGHDQQDLE